MKHNPLEKDVLVKKMIGASYKQGFLDALDQIRQWKENPNGEGYGETLGRLLDRLTDENN